MSLSKTVLAQGKRLLMDAALRLTATHRSLTALSLRELAREAGLNPNTFYRHFKDFDELGLAIIEEMSLEIRGPLRDLRHQAASQTRTPDRPRPPWAEDPQLNLTRAALVTRLTVKLFFDYVAENPNAFILGVRELHGASPLLRQTLRRVMASFAQDMAEDIAELELMPATEPASLLLIAEVISREMFLLSMDYIEQPEQRDAICSKAERLIATLMAGNAVLQGLGPVLIDALNPRPRD